MSVPINTRINPKDIFNQYSPVDALFESFSRREEYQDSQQHPHSQTKAGALVFSLAAMPPEQPALADRLVPGVKKIAVLRSNGIGDFIFSLPALDALRKAYPQAEIVLLALDWHAQFLLGRPGPVDRVIVVPPSKGVRSRPDESEDPVELERFFEQMEKEHFDIGIQMHGGGRYSNPFIQRLGARLTVGSRSEDAILLDRWVPYSFYQLEVLRYLEVVGLVGAVSCELDPQVAVLEQDLAEAASLVPPSSKGLAVIHPGAGDSRRRWPAEKFASLGNSLSWAGLQVVVIGTEGEKDLAASVVDAMSGDAINLCGRISLGGLAGLFSRAHLVVSNDSGPLHLARSVGAPTVGIYWCGNLITAAPVTRARHRTAISWRLECPECGLNCTRHSCGHQSSFVAEISEAEVKSAALELLEMFGRARWAAHEQSLS